MKVSKLLGCLVTFAATFTLLLLNARSAEPNRQLKTALIENLDAFGKQHSLSDAELQNEVGRYALDGTDIVIGRAGLIGKDTYIIFGKERNALLVAGHTWEGKNISEQQVVFIDGQNVTDSADKVDLSKTTIVLFSPAEVRFINLSTFLAGKYERSP